ncbi:MAG: hypothetical protein ACPGU1_07610 [Myxococcota bacterium]
MNTDFLTACSEQLGVAIRPGEASSLLEACQRAKQHGESALEAFLCGQLGDLLFAAEGVHAAHQWYEEGRSASPRVASPWVGLAQVAVAERDDTAWDLAVDALARPDLEPHDRETALRAQGLLAADALRGGDPTAANVIEDVVGQLQATGRAWSAWHLLLAGAVAFQRAHSAVDAECAYEAALRYAQTEGLERGVVWSSLSLCWHVRGSERLSEADDYLALGLEAAEAIGDKRLVGTALALGCDLAAELGHPRLLVERLRQRAELAANEGRPLKRLDYLYQAFVASSRAGEPGAGSQGEEFVEALIASHTDWGLGTELKQIVGTLVAVEATDHAAQLALYFSQRHFRAEHHLEAATWLVEAARLAKKMNDEERAVAMLSEAVEISKMFNLSAHSAWLEERAEWLGSET